MDKQLTDTLAVACSIIALEARCHEEGQTWDREQRKRMAVPLRQFVEAARRLLIEHEAAAANTWPTDDSQFGVGA